MHGRQNGEDARQRDVSEKDKVNALDLALGQIERQFGRGSIMRLGEVSQQMHVEAIPTGSISLDLALGIGGIPVGRITEIFGSESSGKSTLCQHIIAECQQRGGTAAYIDAECENSPRVEGPSA